MKIAIIKQLVLACSFLLCTEVFSIEQLTDSQMADATGQDGLSIKVTPAASNQIGRLGIKQLVVRDRDGFSGTDAVNSGTIDKTGSGSLVVNMASSTGSGIQFCKVAASACASTTDLSQQAIKIDVDVNSTTEGGANPALVVNLSSQADLQSIKLDVASLALRGGAALSQTDTTASTFSSLRGTSAPEYTFAYLTHGVSIDFNSPASGGSRFALGIVLGSSGAMPGIMIKQADIAKINLGTIKLVNNNASSAAVNTISADVSVQNIDLSGTIVDLITSGVIITKPTAGLGAGFDVNVNNMSIGDTTLIPVGVTEFDGVSNGSIGDLRISGVNVTNPRLTIRGL